MEASHRRGPPVDTRPIPAVVGRGRGSARFIPPASRREKQPCPHSHLQVFFFQALTESPASTASDRYLRRAAAPSGCAALCLRLALAELQSLLVYICSERNVRVPAAAGTVGAWLSVALWFGSFGLLQLLATVQRLWLACIHD